MLLQIPSVTVKVLMLEVVEKVCRDVVLREVPGISKCYPAQKMKDGVRVFLLFHLLFSIFNFRLITGIIHRNTL